MITTGAYQNEYSRYGMYQLGLGAGIEQIRQIRHTFLDNIYRQESCNLATGKPETKPSAMCKPYLRSLWDQACKM
jgi:flagellar hook-associated protein 1 FlgK